MTILLNAAACLALVLGIAHSVLGERYILVRLFRRDNIPHLFGSDDFTKKTLRFAWHITTVACWGFAAILHYMAIGQISHETVGSIIGITFLVSAAIALVASRAKHLSWVVFLAIGLIAIFAANS